MSDEFKEYKRVRTDYQTVAVVTRENMMELAEKFKGEKQL